jgi:hypothetical protein
LGNNGSYGLDLILFVIQENIFQWRQAKFSIFRIPEHTGANIAAEPD